MEIYSLYLSCVFYYVCIDILIIVFRDELIYYFNEYRKQGPLSGQKIDDIVAIVERLMKRQKAMRTETIKIQQVSRSIGRFFNIPWSYVSL